MKPMGGRTWKYSIGPLQALFRVFLRALYEENQEINWDIFFLEVRIFFPGDSFSPYND